MKKMTISIEGNEISALTQKVGTTLWVHMNGRTFTYEPERKVRGGKGKAAGGSGEVLAPMPGKINKVSVNVGDKVTAGQVLLVMEAMKMEYTLKASIDGSVAAINCKAGDQVVLGATLAKVTPSESK